jgi:dipeptidyl aminopeptidase/acylaminoacyl peptidase
MTSNFRFRPTHLPCALTFFLLSGLPPAQSQATEPSRAATIYDSMPQAKAIAQAAISPDGTQVAYIVNGEVSIAATSDGTARMIAVEGKLPLREVSWSTDSKQIAFIADLPGEVPAAQIWTAPVDGAAPVKRAELKGYVADPRFSPDGSRLAILFTEGLPRVAGPQQPMTPLVGVIEEKTIYEQRLSIVDLSTTALTQITPSDLYVYEYDWAPDGQSCVATAAHGAGDANWWVARLYRINVHSGVVQEIYTPKQQIAEPRVSPDGMQVAFIEGLMSDEGSNGGDIHIVPITGGVARNLTRGYKGSPSSLAWTGPARITFLQNVDGESGFGSLDTLAGAVQELWRGEESLGTTVSISRDGIVSAFVRQSASTPPEVWVGPMNRWTQITNLNSGVKASWGEMRNFHWTNGKLQLQGWLMLPKNFVPGKTYPLVVDVHGGPTDACVAQWDQWIMGPQSAMGYFAFCPNPRGSFGQGETFTQGNLKDLGGGDYRDIMTGIDAVSKQYPVDAKRIGIRGHSYGGGMAMWAETQTRRFAAVVAGAGICDWLSYSGLNDIDEWMIPFFGASVYDDPAVYAKSDPMHFVKAVKTPTLILVGERDGESPMEQSVEWWHALKAMNVPVQLVIYANEGHSLVKPADSRDYLVRTLGWFDEWFEKARPHLEPLRK